MKTFFSCFYALFFFFIVSSFTNYFGNANVKSRLDVFYTGEMDTLQSLDVFWNDNLENSNVLLFVHGGGWLSGDKKTYRDMASKIAETGLTVILINYRLSPKVKFPDHINDVAASISWTTKNVSAFNGDPHKIFLMGHSAGAHMISLISLDHSYLKKLKIDPNIIAGLISISGVFEIKMQEGGATKRYLEMVFGDEEIWKRASCSTYIDKFKANLPRLFISWGEDEQNLIKNESSNLIKLLNNTDVEFQTFIFEGNNHNAFVADLQNPQSNFSKELIKFLKNSDNN